MTKPDLVALAPCPFCGGEPVVQHKGKVRPPMIYCANEDCMGPHTTAFDMEDATVQWNTRHLASQSSSYEAGPCAWLRDVGVVASDGQHDECLVPASKGDPGAFPVYRATVRPLPSRDEIAKVWSDAVYGDLSESDATLRDLNNIQVGATAILTLLGGSAR